MKKISFRIMPTLSKVNIDDDSYIDDDTYQIKLIFHYPLENKEYKSDSVPAYIYESLYDLENSRPDPDLVRRTVFIWQLLDINEIVIGDEEITILLGVYEYKYQNKNGFTRLDLFRCIYEGLDDIFKASETNDDNIGSGFDDLSIDGIYYNTKTKTVKVYVRS